MESNRLRQERCNSSGAHPSPSSLKVCPQDLQRAVFCIHTAILSLIALSAADCLQYAICMSMQALSQQGNQGQFRAEAR